MVLWEIVCRVLPFGEIRFNSQVEDAVKAGRRPIIPQQCPEGYRALIEGCWAQNPHNRPCIADAVRQLQLLNQLSGAIQLSRPNTTENQQEDIAAEASPLLMMHSDE